MKTNIFIPKTINVGYQNRSDTYTGKLAYVIYYDEKGKLRKEASWNGWRNKELGNDEFENVPTEGFVLNKKVGGVHDSWGWNPRQTYTRVYDPRGFEFEITIPNLLWILECCDSIKGKGLCGQFVYAWDGTELLLMPVDSPNYKEIKETSDIVNANETIKAKNLITGASYMSKDGTEYIYMGKFDYYDYEYSSDVPIKKKKHFYFVDKSDVQKILEEKYIGLCMSAITGKFVKCTDETPTVYYADLFDKMQSFPCYSPIVESAKKLIPYTFEEFEKHISQKNIWGNLRYPTYAAENKFIYSITSGNSENTYKIQTNKYGTEELFKDYKDRFGIQTVYDYRLSYWSRNNEKYVNYFDGVVEMSAKALYERLNPHYIEVYLENGRLFRKDYYYGE